MTYRMLSLNVRLEQVIEDTRLQQEKLIEAEEAEVCVRGELAEAQRAMGPLQLDVDKLHFLLQGTLELQAT